MLCLGHSVITSPSALTQVSTLQKNLWNAYMRPDGSKTVGSMDLGGASTQIAFAVQDERTGSDYMHIKLYGYPYNVYTHSFLCYGKNEAEKMILDAVVQVGHLVLLFLRVACGSVLFIFFFLQEQVKDPLMLSKKLISEHSCP